MISLPGAGFVVWWLDRPILFGCSRDILSGCLFFFFLFAAGFVDSVWLVSWLMVLRFGSFLGLIS
jgi:hypothetical protein